MGDSEKGGSSDGRSSSWLRVTHSRPSAEAGRQRSAFQHHHTCLMTVDGERLYKSSYPPNLEAPLSCHCPTNLCFLEKGSFSVWHSTQNHRDPQPEEQATDLGTWIYPALVPVPGPLGQVINCLRVSDASPETQHSFCRKIVRFTKWDAGLVFRAECLPYSHSGSRGPSAFCCAPHAWFCEGAKSSNRG